MTSSVLGNDIKTGERVELHKASRRQGTYFIAATGVGKSTSLRHLILEDIKQQIGVCVFDPHGDLIDDLIGSLHKKEDRDRVLLLDTTDQNHVFGINLYQCDNPTDKELVTNAYERVEHIFELVWGEDISLMPLVMQGIQNSAYTFIDSSPIFGCTMLEIPLLFRDNSARSKMVAHLRDPDIRSWWEDYYNDAPQGTKDELSRMVVNKITGFTTNRLLRPLIGQSKSTIDFRSVIDSAPGKIVLVKLDRNKEKMTQLIGAMVIAQLLGAALSRRDVEKEKRRQFHIYCDEFETYATDDFTSLLKECRKYGMGMTIAHQSREDISLRNKAASLQVANIIVGRVIPDDANDIAGMFNISPQAAWEEEIEKEWEEEIEKEWHERIEEVVDDGVEEIQTPVSTPFDWLVSGHAHESPVVNRFAMKIHTYLSSEYAKYVRAELNSFLYRAMTSGDPLAVLCEKSLCSLLLYLNDHFPIAPFYFGQTVAAEYYEETTYTVKVKPYIYNMGPITINMYGSAHTEDVNLLTAEVVSPPSIQLYRKKGTTEPDETMAAAIAALIRAADESSFARAASFFQTLARTKLTASLEKYLTRYQAFYETQFAEWPNSLYVPKEDPLNSFFISPIEHGLIFENGRFYTPEEVAKRCSVLPDRIIAEERQAFETFIREFRDFVLALAKEPITSGSGLQQPRKRTQVHYLTHPRKTLTHPRKTITHPQRTYADMQGEIANELTRLPVGIARCRVQNAAGELEEHRIHLEASKIAVAEKYKVEQWIEEIKARMLNEGYLRSIAEVEKEILERHVLLRQPQPQPIVLGLPEQPQSEPSSPRRKKLSE